MNHAQADKQRYLDELKKYLASIHTGDLQDF